MSEVSCNIQIQPSRLGDSHRKFDIIATTVTSQATHVRRAATGEVTIERGMRGLTVRFEHSLCSRARSSGNAFDLIPQPRR